MNIAVVSPSYREFAQFVLDNAENRGWGDATRKIISGTCKINLDPPVYYIWVRSLWDIGWFFSLKYEEIYIIGVNINADMVDIYDELSAKNPSAELFDESSD